MKNYLLLGITGGIATGKTTVVNMLKDRGAFAIDFDILARQVVEPGQPGLKKIIDYFGKQVLQKDGTLDRKKLSKIVFNDPEKRKQLESFTHPFIFEIFFKQVSTIAEKEPHAIIQAGVPLLIELNLQHLFHKIVVVYTSPEIQIQRLTQRDGISIEEATRIIRSQMPIDEKLKYADVVIRNENSLKQTEEQVDALWQSLKRSKLCFVKNDKA